MNTMRNLASLALLAFAAVSPAHAEQAPEATSTPAVANDVPVDGSSNVGKLLEDRPELVALVSGGKNKAIADALKEQLSNAGGEKAVADALNEYLSKHPLKDGQDISDLARDGKEKAIARALKARFSQRP